MSAIIQTGGGNATLTLTYTATIAKMTDVLTKAALYAYEHGYAPVDGEGNRIDFDTLTTQQKLNILDEVVKERY